MKYLAVVDGKNVDRNVTVFGDGEKMRGHCLDILEWATRNPNKPTSLTNISRDTGVPRVSVKWVLHDAACRRQNSTLARVAREHGYYYSIDGEWRKSNKSKRLKPIIKASLK